jgi:hypothetical protein
VQVESVGEVEGSGIWREVKGRGRRTESVEVEIVE